ncbi:MAG: hypothetical protein D8M58_04085 [Calditrichaeota bacterium]|nr:MAG: hypothetical protein DWQ03_02990 [Calditrichota bacterium]MBL1204548.1 hypothetical protein [Calditrichota bacterium]NOG44376.1 hypothetical protein [Calditrichota bacterium]
MEIQDQIEKIRNEIKRHEYNYLVLDESTISEYELNSLKLELDRLESAVRQKVSFEEFAL